ncbi:MAG: hypothetical protein M1550_01950 [Deltaproteobacteria bacterium]|nr:hypothetical protein [Deltaproteobacteria bacterium]
MARAGWFVVTGAGEGIMEAAHPGAAPAVTFPKPAPGAATASRESRAAIPRLPA